MMILAWCLTAIFIFLLAYVAISNAMAAQTYMFRLEDANFRHAQEDRRHAHEVALLRKALDEERQLTNAVIDFRAVDEELDRIEDQDAVEDLLASLDDANGEYGIGI